MALTSRAPPSDDGMRHTPDPLSSMDNSFMINDPAETLGLLTREVWQSEAKYQYESLDFQEVENDLLEEERHERLRARRRQPKLMTKLGDWQKWLLLTVIGLLTGTTAFLIDMGIDEITKRKWDWVGDKMETKGTIPFWLPYLMFAGMNMALCLLASLFVVYVEPLAAGSGIPEVKCYLNGVRIYRCVRLRTLLAKATGILFSVASGLPCGKEGPMIHSGAIIGGGVATGKSSKLHFDTGLFKEYRGDRDKRMFVTAGAAAGVAAAFGAPIGGVLFAVEEVGSFWNLEMSVQVFYCATISAIALNMYGKWHDPLQPASGQTNFGTVTGTYKLWELPLFLLLGCVGGLVGGIFNYLNVCLTKFRRKLVRGIAWRRIAEVCIINFMVSTVLFVLTTRAYTCEPISQLPDNGTDSATKKSFVRSYGCESDDEYNTMATYYFSQTEANIRHLFHGEAHIHYTGLALHFVPYLFLTILTYGIAVPSGLFLPCLALGASLGRIFGQGVHDLMGVEVSYGSYACFGAAAVLGGVIRMTVSLAVIVMEATGNATYIIPLMLITISAKFVGDLFNHGIYDEHIHLQKIPLLENNLEDEELTVITAKDVMNSTDLAILPLRPTVRHLLLTLQEKPHHNAFIVTERGTVGEQLKGLILRRSLLILIRSRAYGGSEANRLYYKDFVKSAHEREYLKVQKYKLHVLPNQDLELKCDLERYMDRFPFTVHQDTPLPRTFRLFRDLGLRHLVVVDDARQPRGLVCRKNLVYLYSTTSSVNPRAFSGPRHPSAERLPSCLFIEEERTEAVRQMSQLLNTERDTVFCVGELDEGDDPAPNFDAFPNRGRSTSRIHGDPPNEVL